MHIDSVYRVNAQPPLEFPQALLEVEAISKRLFFTDDLEVAFSQVGQDVRAGSKAQFRIVLEGQSQPLQPVIAEEVYRIGREALLNAFHHSDASLVELHLEYTATGLRIAVRDNGKGISAELLRAGCNGLSWMRDLAERIGAKFKLLSRVATGTEVLLSIPGHIAFDSPKSVAWALAAA